MREPLFDSHAHLTFGSSFDIEVIKRARDAGVTEIMNIAVDAPSLEKSFELAQQAPFLSLYHAAATTPHDLDGTDDSFFIVVQEAAKNGLLSAIGETGFDAFHRPHGGADQKVVFLRYANLALETGLPLIVHCRDAFDHLLRILREVPVKGVLHCFTGTEEEAKALLDLGWYISVSGIVTFPKSEGLRQIVRFLPLDRMVVETDSPYLAPQPKRGQKNEPSFLVHTVDAVAAIKSLSSEAVARATRANARHLFGEKGSGSSS